MAPKDPKKSAAGDVAARQAELPAFTLAGVRRAARRAGCEQLAAGALERACARLEAFITEELAAAASLAAHCKRRRVMEEDIDFIASLMAGKGKPVPQRFVTYGAGGIKSRRRAKRVGTAKKAPAAAASEGAGSASGDSD